MAQQQQDQERMIGFKSVQLFKDQTLGIGSYGAVCKAKCDDLLCAAKILHPTLFVSTTQLQVSPKQEHRLPIKRFEQECEFLSTIRHPNIVLYLCMHQDPDSGLPVLLMELMDESLTHFLETSPQPIAYHIQTNICHDITLALSFLHSNGIVHRDLSSNNVLLRGNVIAKVTDFGMAKLNSQATCYNFTMCPGTDVYMPPEAVKDEPVYTEKIDCFSFGVIVVQILTRQFPKPGNRRQEVEINHPELPQGTVEVRIAEVDRRQNHICQIDPNHPLLPIEQLHKLEEELLRTQPQPLAALQVEASRSSRADLKLKCRTGEKAPFANKRFNDAIVYGGRVYIRNEMKVWIFDSNVRDWSQLPNCVYSSTSLKILNGLPTTIGGSHLGNPINKLMSLTFTVERKYREWREEFPPMPTKRCFVTAVCTETNLIVAGGVGENHKALTTVEVLRIENRQWSTAESLPEPLKLHSATVCGDQLYMLGGAHRHNPTKSVYTCSVSALLQTCTQRSLVGTLKRALSLSNISSTRSSGTSVWNKLADLPVTGSTCVTFCGQLLAIGGGDSDYKPTTAVFMYNSSSNSWNVIGHMKTARITPFAAVLPDNQLMIVGGVIDKWTLSDSVEFCSLHD